jgi:hypothetical protein
MFLKRASLAALIILQSAYATSAAEVGGRYRVKGTNFDGSPYSGTAEIKVTSNTTCSIVWQTGGTTSKGICMRADDNVFVAAYSMKSGSIGLVAYEIKDDGTLDGVWTMAGEDGAGKDVLTPIR